MQLFSCQACGNVVYFENTRCEACGRALGFLPERDIVSTLEPDGDGFRALAADGAPVRRCANAQYDVCTWLLPAHSTDRLCAACRHNHTIPDTSRAENVARWGRIEAAKHRLFYSLHRLALPTPTRAEDARSGLAFDFLAEPPAGAARIMTGHEDGLITLSLREADDAERTAAREAMHEPYRTLLGHFRHEIGHYYWDRLVREGGRLDDCRALFGDDRDDYQAALRRHYADGPPPDWQAQFISAYATAHPWEDFAETWAHYLHIVETLDTAVAFGLRVRPPAPHPDAFDTRLDLEPYAARDARTLVAAWLPLTYAVNSLNRSMGQPDLYPFILPAPVVDKLDFIHRLIHAG